jgi:hypothetical protein
MPPKKATKPEIEKDSVLVYHLQAVIALIRCANIHCRKEQDEFEKNKTLRYSTFDNREKMEKYKTMQENSQLERNACNKKHCMSSLRLSLKSLRGLLEEKRDKRSGLGLLSAGIDEQIIAIDRFLASKKITKNDLTNAHASLSISLTSVI